MSYDKVAWCTDLSPADYEYFDELSKSGVKAAVITLTASGIGNTLTGATQTKSARLAGLLTHACAITNLVDPDKDAQDLIQRMRELDYQADKSRVVIMPLPMKGLPNNEGRINAFMQNVREWCPFENIDVCLSKEQVTDGEINIDLLSPNLNLTISNVGGLNAGVDCAGTWIYTSKYAGELQLISYDFYQYYTRINNIQGYQLNLDNQYEAQMGDNWWIIAKKHGMSIIDLLELNEADLEDRIMPGQYIKVA